MTPTVTGDRPASHHRRRGPLWRGVAPGRWGRVAGSWLAWWLGASALLLMAAGLGLLALSRHARFPPSMDSWDEQALVILEFVGAPSWVGSSPPAAPPTSMGGCGA